jgi:hypothetical protein
LAGFGVAPARFNPANGLQQPVRQICASFSLGNGGAA